VLRELQRWFDRQQSAFVLLSGFMRTPPSQTTAPVLMCS
jgi:hypothetical protein